MERRQFRGPGRYSQELGKKPVERTAQSGDVIMTPDRYLGAWRPVNPNELIKKGPYAKNIRGTLHAHCRVHGPEPRKKSI